MSDQVRRYFVKKQEYTQLTGLEPTREICAEIVIEMGVIKDAELRPDKVLKRIIQYERLIKDPLSLNHPIGTEGQELEQFIEDEDSVSPVESSSQKQLKQELDEVLFELPPNEARVLRLRYGLLDGNFHTLKEIGKKFGLTRERIRQIEGKAFRRLRHSSRARKLKDFLD